MSNRIVHDYFGLDLEIIWQIIRSDLPALKRDLPPGETDTRKRLAAAGHLGLPDV